MLVFKGKIKNSFDHSNGNTKGEPQMAIIVKAHITITKGFDTWQAMDHSLPGVKPFGLSLIHI